MPRKPTNSPPRRRRKGEGTVYWHEASRQYAAQFSAGTNPDGTRRRFTVYGETEAAVLDKRDRLRADLRLGRLDDARAEGQVKTVAAWLAEWLPLKANLRPKTYKGYADCVRLHLVPALGALPLALVRPSDVQRLLVTVQRTRRDGQPGPLSPRTVRLVLETLRQALDQAEADGLLERNPARSRSVRPPRLHKPVQRPLESDEVAALLAYAAQAVRRRTAEGTVQEPHPLYALWLLAIYHGLREGELLGLQWRDLNLRPEYMTGKSSTNRGGPRLTVRRELVRVEKGTHQPVYDTPKSEAGKRDVALSQTVQDALRAHQRDQARQRDLAQQAGSLWEEHGLVFCAGLGRPLLARNVVRAFKRLLAGAQLDGAIRVHDTRHTAGSAMAAAGIDASTIAEVLGHSDPAFTARTYLHPLRESRARAATSAEAIFGKREPPAAQAGS